MFLLSGCKPCIQSIEHNLHVYMLATNFSRFIKYPLFYWKEVVFYIISMVYLQMVFGFSAMNTTPMRSALLRSLLSRYSDLSVLRLGYHTFQWNLFQSEGSVVFEVSALFKCFQYRSLKDSWGVIFVATTKFRGRKNALYNFSSFPRVLRVLLMSHMITCLFHFGSNRTNRWSSALFPNSLVEKTIVLVGHLDILNRAFIYNTVLKLKKKEKAYDVLLR